MVTVIGVQTYRTLDSEAGSVLDYSRSVLKVPVAGVHRQDLYVFSRHLDEYSAQVIGREVLADRISQTFWVKDSEDPMIQPDFNDRTGNWIVRFAYKTNPLMRDDYGVNARQAIEDLYILLGSLDDMTRRRLFGIDGIPDLETGEIRRVQEFTLYGGLRLDDVKKINHRRLSDVKVHDSVYIPVVG